MKKETNMLEVFWEVYAFILKCLSTLLHSIHRISYDHISCFIVFGILILFDEWKDDIAVDFAESHGN